VLTTVPPTAVARVRAKVRSCGIRGGRSGTGAGFRRVLRFPLPILIPPTTPHSTSIIRGWYNRPISGRRTKWTQLHATPSRVASVSWKDLLTSYMWTANIMFHSVVSLIIS
jgi:hypothetical protein